MELKLFSCTGMNQMADMGEGIQASKEPDPQIRELFLPFRCFCTRKDVSFHHFLSYALLQGILF